MRLERLRELRCPYSHSPLRLVDAVLQDDRAISGTLVSPENRVYPIESGIPRFVDPARLSEIEARTKNEYDRVADEIYDAAVDWQFAAMYEDEQAVRESMIDMLRLTPEANVLEVGCGTGRDSTRLAARLDARGRLHLQDLSSGMVEACARAMSRHTFSGTIDYSVASATRLPFGDGAFDAVFHFGGFNQFGDLKAAAAELTRVAKPGGRIVFGDEAVAPWLRGTEFDAIVTTNNPLFMAAPPLDALPAGARDVVVRWIIGNCFYVIGFAKGDGPPPLNLDLPHKGWRGGTMRTRYFGVLEGVTSEAKEMARASALRCGISVHEWLDRLIRDAAAGTGDGSVTKR
jgi:ubiquinone/menaquinone biosynthesis C-methylase UbiE